MKYYIGTSGWHYDHWRHGFYPEKLAKSNWLEYYAGHFSTVELNNTFYRLPSVDAFAGWYKSAPADFVFAVKVSRFITHIKRLRDCQEPLGTFISRAKGLGEKLGPLLYQLPPNMRRDDRRLEAFLSILPLSVKHVFEFRHPSWLEDEVFEILHRYNVGFCIFDMPDIECPLKVTADFAYIRFHGSTGLYASCYSDGELADWARRLSDLATGLQAIYIYFNNDIEGFAVRNATTLGGLLQGGK